MYFALFVSLLLLFLPCLDAYEITPMCLLDLNIQPIKLKLNKCFFLIKNSDLFI